MAVEKSGIRLEAENAAQFLSTLARGAQALNTFAAASTSAAMDVQKLAKTSKEIQLDKLNRQLDDQSTRLGIAAQKMVELTNKYGAASTQVQSHEAAMKRLAGQMSETQDRILLTERQIAAEAKAATDATSHNASFQKALKDLAGQADDTGKKVNGMSEIMIGGLRKIGEVGVESLGGLLKSMKDFGVNSVKTAGDFEASLNRFASVTDSAMKSAGLDISDAKEMFLELGATTQFSASQVSSAANELVKGGVDIKDVMGEATKATLDLAAAGEVDLVTAGEIVAKQLGVWGDEAGGATNAVNLLAQSANASTVNVDDLALGLANAGGVAKGAGLSFEDTVSAIGLIAPGFSSASDAGTSFKAFLNQLIPTTTAQKDAMRELGLFTDETGSKFFDASGAFIGMEQASGLLKDATKDLSAEQRTLALELAFGSDAQRAALGLAEEGAEGWRNFAAEMDATGTAAEQAAKKNQGFNFAMESLGGAVETLMIRLGDKFLPILTDVINKGLIPIVNWLSTKVGPAFDDFVAGAEAAGRGLEVVGNWIDDRLVPALGLAATALGVYTIAQTAAFISGMGGIASTFSTIGAGLGLVIQRAPLAAAALGPIAVAGAALAGVVVILNKYAEVQERIATGTDEILQSRQWYQDASVAVGQYAAASGGASEETKRLAAEVQAQQAAFDAQLEEFVAVTAELDIGAEAEAQWMAQINAGIPVLEQKTAALNASIAADREHNQEIGQSQAGLRSLREGVAETTPEINSFGQAVQLSKEKLAELATVAEDAKTAGVGVFGEMEGSFEGHVSTMAVLQDQYNNARTEKEREGLQQQMNQQIVAYANQEQVQRESLGRQMIALVEARGMEAELTTEQIKAATDALRAEYGIQEDITVSTLGAMDAATIAWATSGGENVQGFIDKLNQTSDSALESQRALAEMEGTYEFFLESNLEKEIISEEQYLALMREMPTEHTMHLFQNFMAGTIDAEEFLRQVNAIPASKTINIHTSYTSSGERPIGKGGAEARAKGGPVTKGKPYRVAEEDWELFVGRNTVGILGLGGEGFFTPPVSGHILSHEESIAAMNNGQLQPLGRSTMPLGGSFDTNMNASSGSSLASSFSEMTTRNSTSSLPQSALDTIPAWQRHLTELAKGTTETSLRSAFQTLTTKTKSGFHEMWGEVLGGLKDQTSSFANTFADVFAPFNRSAEGSGSPELRAGFTDLFGKPFAPSSTPKGPLAESFAAMFGGNAPPSAASGNVGSDLASSFGQMFAAGATQGGGLGGGFSTMPITPPASQGQILGGFQFPAPSGETTNNFNLTVQTAPDPRGAVGLGFRQFQVFGGF